MSRRSQSALRSRAGFVSIALSLALLFSLCGPFLIHSARAQVPIPTPTPGKPPGPDLPNLDVIRKLQSLVPPIIPGVPGPIRQPCNDDNICVGGGSPPSPPANDPGYATPRTEPRN